MNRYIGATFACVAILSACVGLPEPVGQPSLPVAPRGWDSDERATQSVEAGWILKFEDALLTSLVEEAQVNNPNIAMIAASVRRARALSDSARAGLVPEVLLVGGGTSNGNTAAGISDNNLTSASLSASWEPDLWGRIRTGASAAHLDAKSAATDEIAARRVLASAVIDAYVLAIDAGLQAGVAKQTFRDLTRTLEFVTVQFERGLRSGRDIALIRSDAAVAEASIVTSQNAQRDALRSLEVLIGRYPDADIALQAHFPRLPDLPNSGAPAELLEQRPDIAIAALQVEATLARHNSAKAETRPSLTLTGLIGVDGDGISGVFDPVGLGWNAAANLAAPLIDGGARRANVEIAAADIDSAVAFYRETVLQAWTAVEQQLDLGQALAEQETLIDAALAEAVRAFNFTEYSYEIGEADLLDVLSLQQRVSALESQKVSIRSARLVQVSQLSLALGADWIN